MGALSEVGNDFMKMLMTLAVIGALVFMFFIWSAMGIIAIIGLIVLMGGGYIIYKVLKNR